MYRKLEELGTALLGLFVPKVTAAADECAYYLKYFDSCWQCNYYPCARLCADGCGCTGPAYC